MTTRNQNAVARIHRMAQQSAADDEVRKARDAARNRAAQEQLRTRRHEAGLVRVEVWTKPEFRDRIRKFARDLLSA